MAGELERGVMFCIESVSDVMTGGPKSPKAEADTLNLRNSEFSCIGADLLVLSRFKSNMLFLGIYSSYQWFGLLRICKVALFINMQPVRVHM